MRLFQLLFSHGSWFEKKQVCTEDVTEKCIPEYNEDLMDPLEDGTRFLVKILVVAGILLDLLCIKYRNLANMYMYLECFTQWIVTFIPNYASYESDVIGYSMIFALFFLLFYNDDGKHIICSTLTMAWHVSFALFVAYNRPYTLLDILFNSGVVIGFLILQIILGMIIVHMSKIHSSLFLANEEHINLLNGMHEGILILSREDQSVMFSNKPTQKLIRKFLGYERFLFTKSFRPLKFSKSDSENLESYYIDENNNMSLNEIILE